MKYVTATGVIGAVLLFTPLLAMGAPQGSSTPRLIGNKARPQTAPDRQHQDEYEFRTIDVTGMWAAAYGVNDTRLAVGVIFIPTHNPLIITASCGKMAACSHWVTKEIPSSTWRKSTIGVSHPEASAHSTA